VYQKVPAYHMLAAYQKVAVYQKVPAYHMLAAYQKVPVYQKVPAYHMLAAYQKVAASVWYVFLPHLGNVYTHNG
jgi:hypothetical protein